MFTSYISTDALRQAPRADLVRLQSALTDRAKEVATGRHADVGLALGTGTGGTVETRMDRSLLDTLMRSNALATARLEQTQNALSDLETVASDMLGALIALPPGEQAARTLTIQAETSLDRLADRMNASDGGSYLFAGINSDEAPFTRFDDGPRAAITAAFQTRFGFPPDDPAAVNVTAADMRNFLSNEFADLFADPDWGAAWSVASSTNMTSRIAPSERVETSTNANEPAIRNLARGFSMLAGLGFEGLNEATREAVVDEARLVIGDAITDLVSLKSELGFAENAIARASNRMSLAADILSRKVAGAEEVDPAEAKTRIDLLTTQIEMSYALTNQLGRLSILNYA